ncbi:hypothetical protein ACLB2K_059451 [Fragaria x ananassa]
MDPCSTIEDCLVVCWHVWKARNNSIFRSAQPFPNSVIFEVASSGVAYRACISFVGFDLAQAPLPAEVIRNVMGHPLVAGARRLFTTNVPLLKVLLLKDGLLAAKRFNYHSIMVVGDSLITINCVKKACETPWRLMSIVRDI